MASGCTSSGQTSSSVLFQKLTPDTLVQYTGVPYPQFGICTGDLLSEVEDAILKQIVGFAAGQGITLADIDLTSCDCFKAKVGCCGKTSCQTLECILQAYLECMCEMYADIQTLKSDLTALTTKVNAMNDGPYVTKCLVGVTSSSKLPAIVQAIIDQTCANTTAIGTLTTSLPTTIGNFLNTAIRSCQIDAVKKSGTGASFNVTFAGFAPIGSIMMYGGPIAGVFDSTGLGISPGPACGWALCNGVVQNGIQTVDMRGYFPVGVNNGSMGGGSQNPEVDNGVNPGQTYGLNAHGGEIKHQLSTSEMPSTPVTVSGAHTHDITGVSMCKSTTTISNNAWVLDLSTSAPGTCPPDATNPPYNIPYTFSNKISTYTGTYSGTVNGGNGKHENRPPYRAVYFIQRVA